MDLSINFKNNEKKQIDTHTQKIIFLFFILNYLILNLQEIPKILKLKTQIFKKFNTQTSDK